MYLNPKVAAGAVVEHQGGIVLLRREIDPRAGFWVHPGGFVDRGETLEQAAKRETREEVGLEVEIGPLLGAFSFADSEVVVVTYAARAISGEPIAGDESLEVRTFDPRDIPWADLAFPSTRLALEEYGRLTEGLSANKGRAPVTVVVELDRLMEARDAAFKARDARAGSLVYPRLINQLRDARRFKEALLVAEEGLALTHDPLIARLADETAHELAAAEQERC
jgi:mutator protein MutT